MKIGLSRKLRISVAFIVVIVIAAFFIAHQLTLEKERAAITARKVAQAKLALSQKRHMDFFGVDAWKHQDFVRKEGPRLCVICHALGTEGPRNFGPRCTDCHEPLWDDSIRKIDTDERPT